MGKMVGKFETALDWTVLQSGRRRLNAPLIYTLLPELAEKIGRKTITVPGSRAKGEEGFISDGYSFPRLAGFPSLLGGKYEVAPEAAVVHDYLCENPEITGSRYATDLVLQEAMLSLKKKGAGFFNWIKAGLAKVRRGVIFAGVRTYSIATGKK